MPVATTNYILIDPQTGATARPAGFATRKEAHEYIDTWCAGRSDRPVIWPDNAPFSPVLYQENVRLREKCREQRLQLKRLNAALQRLAFLKRKMTSRISTLWHAVGHYAALALPEDHARRD